MAYLVGFVLAATATWLPLRFCLPLSVAKVVAWCLLVIGLAYIPCAWIWALPEWLGGVALAWVVVCAPWGPSSWLPSKDRD